MKYKYIKNTDFKKPISKKSALPENFWISISSEAYSKAVQKILIEHGYGWNHSRSIKNTEKELLCIIKKTIYYHGSDTYQDMLDGDTASDHEKSYPVLSLSQLIQLLN